MAQQEGVEISAEEEAVVLSQAAELAVRIWGEMAVMPLWQVFTKLSPACTHLGRRGRVGGGLVLPVLWQVAVSVTGLCWIFLVKTYSVLVAGVAHLPQR